MEGEPCNSERCPIALALKRWLFGQGIHYADLSVTLLDIEIVRQRRKPVVRYWYDAARWAREFDAREPVQPRIVNLARLP